MYGVLIMIDAGMLPLINRDAMMKPAGRKGMIQERGRAIRRWLLAAFWVLLLAPWAWGQFAPAAVEKPLLEERKKAALIRLYGPVDDIMFQSLKRRVDLARKQGCDLIIYQLDTYGGLLTAALDISRFTKTLSREIPVIAYVDSKAISAGAIIAVACDQMVMAPSATIGDCEPISVEGGKARALDENLRAKVSSPLLEELRDSAQRNHYQYLLLEAMVVRETEVWAIRNNVDVNQPPRYVSGQEKAKTLEELNKLPNGGHGNAWVLDPKPIDSDHYLLTVNSTEAVSLGLAKAEVGSEQQLRALCNLRGDLIVMDFVWLEGFVRWLTDPWVRFGLFVTMLVLAYIEFAHPGISVAGIGALICLGLLVGAPFMTGLAQVWEVVLIVLGAGIIIVDLVLYGGVGLLAVPGFILMAIGLVASFVPADPNGHWIPQTLQSYNGLRNGLMVIVFGSLSAMAIFFLLSRYLYLTPGFRRLQLAPAGPAPERPVVRDATDRPATDVVFVGAMGMAVSDLRPAGKARFDTHLIDVVSEGQFITEGTTVVVLEIAGARVVVKPHSVPAPNSTDASQGEVEKKGEGAA